MALNDLMEPQLPKGPVSKYRHVLRSWGLGFQHVDGEVHNSVITLVIHHNSRMCEAPIILSTVTTIKRALPPMGKPRLGETVTGLSTVTQPGLRQDLDPGLAPSRAHRLSTKLQWLPKMAREIPSLPRSRLQGL